MSRRYVSMLLSKQGVTFSRLLRDARLEMAERILRSACAADYTIEEVALRVGFKDVGYFSRVFKAASQCSPGNYRRSAP
jgi:AraC-like DNA-binding protein